MKKIAAFFVLTLFFSCSSGESEGTLVENRQDSAEVSEPSQAVNAPNLHSGIDLATQNTCRAEMTTLSTMITVYEAQNGGLPQTLDELTQSLGGSATSPSGRKYRYVVDGNSWTLSCPANPSHGSITNGVTSW